MGQLRLASVSILNANWYEQGDAIDFLTLSDSLFWEYFGESTIQYEVSAKDL